MLALASCGPSPEKTQEPAQQAVQRPLAVAPAFNADSAFRYVAEQVAFGPRVPGTRAHSACSAYLRGKLEGYGMAVTVQNPVIETHDRRKYELANVIGSYRPELTHRILLCSHWDTRPFADRDTVRPGDPFDGANDGGSNTAVLLEIARQLSIARPAIGVDLVFFDLEDYGQANGDNDTWGLGSQYWSRHPHKPGYYARFGILLDMVGWADPQFPREGYSMQYARTVVDRVWRIAREKGYGRYFIDSDIQGITDDHYFVNRYANIPCIDIIHYDPARLDFMPCHHRHCDNLDNIDPFSLKIAGQVVLETLYDELNTMP